MTDEEKQKCLNELRSLVAEFYGEDGSAFEQRKAARKYISSVQDLPKQIDTLTEQVKKLEDQKADRAHENESDKDLGSLVQEVERLKNLINGKRDASDASLIPKDVDTQINKLWEKLYALEEKHGDRWRGIWSGFHPTVASFSPKVASGSLTDVELGVGGLALKVRVWYFTYDIQSVTLNVAKVKLSGTKSWFWVMSLFSCGLAGLVCACKQRTNVSKVTKMLMSIKNRASSIRSAAASIVA